MSEKQFDFKSFILDDTQTASETEEKQTKAKSKPEVDYTIEWKDHCDVIISRSTKKTQSWLVLMMSKGQFYVKDTSGNIKTLTSELLAKFFDKHQDGFNVDTNWLGTIVKGKIHNEEFIKYINHPLIQKFAKANLIYNDSSDDCRILTRDDCVINHINKIFNMLQKTMKFLYGDNYNINAKKYIEQQISENHYSRRHNQLEYNDKYILDLLLNDYQYEFIDDFKNNYRSIKPKDPKTKWTTIRTWASKEVGSPITFLIDAFGESGAFEYMQSIYHQLHTHENIDCRPNSYVELLKNVTFKCDRFIEYVTWQPIVQGYDISSFLDEWADTLRMQMMIYGYIKDKYPESLAASHRKLSHQVEILQHAQDEEIKAQKNKDIAELKKQYKNMLWNDKDEKYAIVMPECINDILEEASAMSNCLASYVDRIASGQSQIFFLRRSDDIEKPLCDIEVIGNRINQAYCAKNIRPKGEIRDFIEIWAKKNNLIYNK